MPRRAIIKLGVFLLAGAIINFGVVWGIAMRQDRELGFYSPHCLFTESSADLGPIFMSQCTGEVQLEQWLFYPFIGMIHSEYVGYAEFISRLPRGSQLASNNPVVRCRQQQQDDRVINFVFRESWIGWPFLATTGSEMEFDRGNPPTSVERDYLLEFRKEHIPYRPLWPGFAINTIFYTVIVWLLFVAKFQFRRWRRIKRGLCPACAYPVGSSDVCTECGGALNIHSVRPGGGAGV